MADFNAMGALNAFTAGRAYRNAEEDRQRQQGLQNTQAKAQAALMSGDANAARELAMGSNDAATMQAVQAQLGQMNEQQRQAARERVQGLGAAAYTLAQIPAEQRSQWVMQNGQSLAGLGINPQQIAQMDLSDQNLSAFIRQAEAMQAEFFAPYSLGENEARFTVSGGAQLNPNAALNRGVDQARLAETVRSNRADEGIARQGVAIDRFQADTGRLAEMRQREAFDLESAGSQGGDTTFSFGAEGRARVAINLPAIEVANQQLEQLESAGVRFNSSVDNTVATALDSLPFGVGDSAARTVGGDDFSALQRASSAFEAAMLPIMSGAAVTESEARRLIRATLPRPGDSDAVLRAKRAQRESMVAMARAGIEGGPVNIDRMISEMRTLAGVQPGAPEEGAGRAPAADNNDPLGIRG